MQARSKQELRKIYREKRLRLSTDQYQRLNKQLLEQVHQLDTASFSTVHLFLPIEGNREPDTYAIAAWLRHNNPGIRLALPRTSPLNHHMDHVLWDDTIPLEQNHWGIPEPQGGDLVSSNEIDVVFIPLLAFDVRGNRVGYGKGFYDRFLADCQPDTTKIGLSLFDAEPAISGVDPFDIPLDYCITPKRIWNFSTVPGI